MGIVMLIALAPAATGAIKIAKIRFNPPGPDTPITNAKLNAEWISIKNTGNSAVQLNGWRVRDRAGNVFKIGSLALPGGAAVRIHTGSGLDSFPNHLYWGRSKYVWNNNADSATLRRPNGRVADRCSYSGGGSAVTC
ncbi:MAG TPA: lamin tail domain-containing protein [Gaiellaceae bacterium]|nr:lamin tail domain-containing protein [Gaiellaceae bacterium]